MLPIINRRLRSSALRSFIALLAAATGLSLGCGSIPPRTVPLDTTPPTITATASPQPNASGWNNTSVTVTFTCSDAESGVATCPAPQMVSAEGANQVITGTAADNAGNKASASITLNIDETPPNISAVSSPGPNAAGWNNSDVTVSFTCTDSLSGVANCPQPTTVTTEGANQTVTGTVMDIAGNSAVTLAGFNLDKTPPVATAVVTPAPNANGWNNQDVTVVFNCDDSLSGVASCPTSQEITSEGSNQLFAGTVIDNAGNSSNASVTVNLDRTPPTLQIKSPSGGSALSPSTPFVAVAGTGTDNLSGISAASCNGSPGTLSGQTFSCPVLLSQGSNPVSVQVADAAGNVANSSVTFSYVPAPQITITAPANLSITNFSPVTVNGAVGDPSATVTVNGIAALQGSGGFSIPVPLVEGLNTLAVVATGSNGIAGTATVQVTLDTTPPHISIDTPADGTITTDSSVTVTGLANDIVVGTVNVEDVQVTVNGTAAQVANRNYSVANLPLAVGPNTIQATGMDRAGNGTTKTITVTRVLPGQAPAPAIGQAVVTDFLSVVSGNSQTGTIGTILSTPLVVMLKDSSGMPVGNQPVVFKVTGDNGMVSAASAGTPALAVVVNTDANGQAQAWWTLGQRSGAGINAMQVSSALAVGSANFSATGLVGPSAQIVVDSGNQQTGAVGQPLAFPFVAVVVDSGHNRVPGVPVTFVVKQGGGTLTSASQYTVCSGAAAGSSTSCGGDNPIGATTQTITTDSNGRAIAVLTLGFEEGLANNIIEAQSPCHSGFPAAFAATAMAPGDPANTTISGVVLNNSNNPIPGVTMRLYQTNQGNVNNLPVQIGTPVQTNAQGSFVITSAPVGSFKLMADGSTATTPQKYPPLEYDVVTVAGNDNTVGMPIYLPSLDTVNKLCVDETHGGTLTLPQIPGFSLTVLPGSASFPGGSRQGCISVTAVNGDKIPMTPGFGQQPRFIVTIQPVGTSFNPPAPMTLPNVDGLQPREVTEMYSYDHDLGMFVAIGTGTVSADGSAIVSNPGVGVLKAGWHCGGDPTETGSAATCDQCQACHGSGCEPDPTITATCDDGLFCTQHDACTGGACKGTPIPPQTILSSPGVSISIDSIFAPVKSVLQTIFGDGAPDLSFSISGSEDVVHKCCESMQDFTDNKVKKISASLGVSAPSLPIPGLSVVAGSAQFGLFGTLGVSASVGIQIEADMCSDANVATASGTLSASIGLKLQAQLPLNVVKASLSGSGGLSGTIAGTPETDDIDVKLSAKFTGLVAKATVQFASGIISISAQQVLLPPQTLGEADVTVPYQ